MRIPSDFNDESLYRRQISGQNGDFSTSNSIRSPGSKRIAGLYPTSATRRLLRLIVGLVLVVFLMRKLASPEIYQPFFSESMQKVPTNLPGGQQTSRSYLVPDSLAPASTNSGISDERTQLDLYSRNSPEFRDAVRLIRFLSADEAQAVLFGSSTAPEGNAGASIAANIEKLAESLEPFETPTADWLALAEQLRSGPNAALGETTHNKKWRLFAAIRLAALDSAVSRVVDGSVWRNGDLDAFYGAMIQRDLVSNLEHVQTGVLPMLQQPEVYRGNGVSVIGKVVRGEQLDSTSKLMGIKKYWQLWLRPTDGSERPIVAVVAELPAEIAAKLTPENDAEMIPQSQAAQVQVNGMYLKRLAYRSGDGAELAPVVVGVIAAMSESLMADTAGPAGMEPTATLDRRSLFVLALTVSLGVVIAAVVMIRSRLENTRLRLIRGQQLADTILIPPLFTQANEASKDVEHD